MGCCGGDREKDAVIKNDVKWEYVVSTARGPCGGGMRGADRRTESQRLQILVVLDALRLHLPVAHALRLDFRLRGRHIYRDQSARLQPVGWSDQTCS